MARLAACLGLLVALLAPPVHAQDPAGAEAAALAYVTAVSGQDWAAAAALIDPADLVRLGELVELFDRIEPGTASALGLDADDPIATFTAIVTLAITQEPLVGEALGTAEPVVMGTISEGDSLAHVLVRTRLDFFGEIVEAKEIISARWSGDEWRVLLADDFEFVLVGIRLGLERPELFGGEPIPVVDPKKQR